LQIYSRTLQEHSLSMNSVPWAYFRISLRDCAIHSSRRVHLADFGLVWFCFFVRWIKMMRAFVKETTARLRCVRLFVKLYSVMYVAICCLPHMAIVCHHQRGSTDIFRPRTESSACGRCAFLFLGPLEWTCFQVYVKADLVTSTLLWPVCPWGRHGCSWATMRVCSAREKNGLTKKTIRHLTAFFCFSHTPTHACARKSRTTLCFKACKSVCQTNSHEGIPNLASNRSTSHFWIQNVDFSSSPECKSQGARILSSK